MRDSDTSLLAIAGIDQSSAVEVLPLDTSRRNRRALLLLPSVVYRRLLRSGPPVRSPWSAVRLRHGGRSRWIPPGIGPTPLLADPDEKTVVLCYPIGVRPRTHELPGAALVVAKAAESLAGGEQVPQVSELALRLGISSRHLSRSFRSILGLSTKRFLRLFRFERALRVVDRRSSIDWADVAAECGYFDQTHLIREFREFARLTPCEWLEARSEYPLLVSAASRRQVTPNPRFASRPRVLGLNGPGVFER